MNPILLHIYGPLKIHPYGLFIVIGAIITFYLTSIDPKVKKLLSTNEFITICQLFLIGSYVGGRIGHFLSEPAAQRDPWLILKFWEPGFAALGGVVGLVVAIISYLYIKNIPVLAFADRLSIYGPIAQSFGRIGCFFTGCCYGAPTKAWYAVTYTHPNHIAPLHCALHPAQLYSAALLMGIFLFLYFVQQYRTEKAGVLFCTYLVLAGVERFLIDFVRWDRIFMYEPPFLQLFSVHQWFALLICIIATIGLIILEKRKA